MIERELWQAVITRAVFDTDLKPICLDGKTGKLLESMVYKNAVIEEMIREAKEWLDNADDEFRLVCELAGFHPDQVHAAWKSGALSPEALKSLDQKND